MTKGQQAIMFALMYPDSEKGGRGKKSIALNSKVSFEFSDMRYRQARHPQNG
jgi:hypothetical protein